MPLTLHIDGDRWRDHLRRTLSDDPALVPVAKGNGYGLGLGRLARRAQWLGVDTLAVGQYEEVAAVESRFGGSILVLTPYRGFVDADLTSTRLVHTIGRAEDLRDLISLASIPRRGPRVVLELLTSMRRHGFTGSELRAAVASVPGRVQVEGIAMHLPLASTGDHSAEVHRLMTDVVAADLETRTIWVSHLPESKLATLRAHWPDYTFRPRVGTALWLGDRGALSMRSTVLDTHPLTRGERFGYRGRSLPRKGTLVVVSGGTSHGIGLDAPLGETSIRGRAGTLARGGLDAAGLARSPFFVDGRQRYFAEPPHMQVSMLYLPAGADVPAIGDEIDLRVRFTTTTADRVVIS